VGILPVLERRAEVRQEQAEEVQQEELDGADVLLERKAEEVERDHVEREMPPVGVHETAGDEPVVLAIAEHQIRPKDASFPHLRVLERDDAQDDRERENHERNGTVDDHVASSLLEKIASDFFDTAPRLPAAKGVVFAACL